MLQKVTDPSEVTAALQVWQQGDAVLMDDLEFVHLARLDLPLTDETRRARDLAVAKGEEIDSTPAAIATTIDGIVVISQTCDVVRSAVARPFVRVAPLIQVDAATYAEVKAGKRPAFVAVPTLADKRLVGDLDRAMTVEKTLLATWPRTAGCASDAEVRDFAAALGRLSSRFAFPDSFEPYVKKMMTRIKGKHGNASPEGSHLASLREIRVRASPSWGSPKISLELWFIKEDDPTDCDAAWRHWIGKWLELLPKSELFSISYWIDCHLEDLSARDYVESDRLDLDWLSS